MKPPMRVRVTLLYKRRNQTTITGTPKCIEKFSETFSVFFVDAVRSNGDTPDGEATEIVSAVSRVIERAKAGRNTDRLILKLAKDTDDWLVTIQPIFPVIME